VRAIEIVGEHVLQSNEWFSPPPPFGGAGLNGSSPLVCVRERDDQGGLPFFSPEETPLSYLVRVAGAGAGAGAEGGARTSPRALTAANCRRACGPESRLNRNSSLSSGVVGFSSAPGPGRKLPFSRSLIALIIGIKCIKHAAVCKRSRWRAECSSPPRPGRAGSSSREMPRKLVNYAPLEGGEQTTGRMRCATGRRQKERRQREESQFHALQMWENAEDACTVHSEICLLTKEGGGGGTKSLICLVY